MQSILIANRIDIVVLVPVQIILDAFGLHEKGTGEGRIKALLAGLIDHPFTGQADHLVLSDLQGTAKNGNHEHDDGDVISEHVPPRFQDAVRRLRVHKVPQFGDGDHGSAAGRKKEMVRTKEMVSANSRRKNSHLSCKMVHKSMPAYSQRMSVIDSD